MRFNTVEIGHAYSDYLDFLEDWPPPEDAPSVAPAMESSNSDLDTHGEQRGDIRVATRHH